MSHQNLLVELFVEELPPKSLKRLGEELARLLTDSLKAQGLVAGDAVVSPFATPRRLAVHVQSVAAIAPSQAVQQKLMPVAVAFDELGLPSAALMKKLDALGADLSHVPNLRRQGDGKAEVLFLDRDMPGVALAEGLQKALAEAIAKLPIPKVMSYQLEDRWTSVHFVRPAHGLVALHGAEVVAVTALGLHSGRRTQGHRFEASTPSIDIEHADRYEAQLLEQGAVIASFGARRAEILRQLGAAALRQGAKPIDDEALLDEVTALVERPHVLLCRFEPEYLAVPSECLILTMKANQKYFPLLDPQGQLTERFLVVSNIRPSDAGRIIEGNERVVRPRLADAKFFFDHDRKKTLLERVPLLAKVVYHGKLGTQGERVERVRAIARSLGERLGGAALAAVADRAALLAKADLLTGMVGEFPELQGIMGGYYARHDGETEAVAFAVEDHYKPRFAGDALPRGDAGLVVALADKLETLAGLFGIGQLPSGDKDPFALRRHALGVVRMLVEGRLALELPALVELAVGVHNDEALQQRAAARIHEAAKAQAQAQKASQGGSMVFGALFVRRQLDPKTGALVLEFIAERLAGSLREQGYSVQEVDAVLSLRPARLADVTARLAAVRAFAALPEAAPLAAANKRVGNILKKADGGVPAEVDTALLKEPAELALHLALAGVAPLAGAAFERGDYTVALQALATLKAPVDAFFDAVMVNADDAALRANRLGLLAQLHQAMNRVADLSKLAA